ncbi:MAG: Outer rane efflux protein [Acidobacteria bacterium]|jgi:outer membrane protein TolC|nr:Outer rane efflux protein [Acidobacteriota bacterium]
MKIPAVGLALLTLLPLAAASARAGEVAPPLTLAEALELAATRSETPAIAAARLERAEALRRQAVAALLPAFTVTGTYTRRPDEVVREIGGEEVTVQAIDALSGQAVAETVLFDLRALPLLRAATRGVEAQRLESDELRRALAFDVATGFLTVLSAERLRDATAERVRVAAVTSDEARARLEAGLAGRNDVTRTELELATARLTETRAVRDVSIARFALAYLVGAPVETRPLALPDDFEHSELDLEALTARALAHRGELAALAERAEQARQLAIAPRYGILPRFDARGTYRWTNESGLSGNETDWNFAVGLTWEIWDGGSRAALAAQLDAEAREAELTLEQSRRQVALEVAEAATAAATAEAAVEQAGVRSEVARDNAVEVRERFSNGLATALEQADAQVEQFEADAELVRQRYARAVARLALGRAVGDWPPGARPTSATPPNPEAQTP